MIIDNLIRGGRERRMLSLLQGLRKHQDIQVEIVILSRKIEYPEIFDLGWPIHILERKPAKDPRVFIRFFKICRKFRPQIVHSWGIMSSIYSIPSIKLLKIKFINGNIYDAPSGLSMWDSRFFRAKLTFPFSDVVLANSAAGLKAYKAPQHRGRFIHNGMDVERGADLKDRQSIYNKYKIDSKYLIGMIGAFHERKDYRTFLEAGQMVLEKCPEVSLIAVGDGPNLSACRKLVDAHFKNRVHFLGQVEDVESLINVLDVGVLSTNAHVHGEGISNAIMEYMFFAKPVVATDGGGTPEIVLDGVTGFLVPSHSSKDLADKITYLLHNPKVALEMGKRGKMRVEEKFSLALMVDRYLNLYQEVFKNEER